MRIGVAGSMQFTEKLMELCESLEKLGHEAFMSKSGPAFVGKSPIIINGDLLLIK